jgi:MFS family permease
VDAADDAVHDTASCVVAAVFVLGVVNDAFRPGSNTAAAMSAALPELRRKALSLNRFALNLGWAFGPTIGGYLVHDYRVDVRRRRRHLRPRGDVAAWKACAAGTRCRRRAHHRRRRRHRPADARPPLPVR